MEHITKEDITSYISNNSIELNCTQTRLCIPIINRIYKKMCAGIVFADIRIQKDLICDGHHRYIASLLAKYDIGKVESVSSAQAVNWEMIEFVEDDWDTPAKIKMLNDQDAKFNNTTIEAIEELLN